MKEEISSSFGLTAAETGKILVYAYPETNRNSFAALSEIGIICGIILGAFGLLTVWAAAFFERSIQINNLGLMLIFFSLVLLIIGAGNRYKATEDKKTARDGKLIT